MSSWRWLLFFGQIQLLSLQMVHVPNLFLNRVVGWLHIFLKYVHPGCLKTMIQVDLQHIFQMGWWKTTQLHPGKLTWNPKMEVWKMIFLFNWVIVRFHVNFQGCSKVWLLKNLNVSGSGNRKKKPSKSSTGGHLISWRPVEHGYRHRMFRTMGGDRDWKVSWGADWMNVFFVESWYYIWTLEYPKHQKTCSFLFEKI